MQNICGMFRVCASATLTILLFLFVLAGVAFPQSGTSSNETILPGSLVIPMDNDLQGNSNGCAVTTAFNLRAYGLVVRLLHNNIPVKWAIDNKVSKDGVDFSAEVSQFAGPTTSGCRSGANTVRPFSGGPLIVAAEYTALATPFITAFNNEIANNADDVRVYQIVTSSVNVPIRYTLTHKPLVAVGPDGGNFGTGVHQALFDDAKLRNASNAPYYASVTNEIIGPNSCYTVATQAHASATAGQFVGAYRDFAEAGGNLLLQCASVGVFENNLLDGLFQTTNGWTVLGTNDSTDVTSPLVYPNPAMPFNQFVGALANQDGAITDYRLAGGSAERPSFLRSVSNSGTGLNNTFVASVNKVGTPLSGGNVFELGGHDYYRTTAGTTEQERINGQRMILNTILVPATRSGCGLDIPVVRAFKSVRIHTNTGPVSLTPGDTVEWTIQFINTGLAAVSGFQITDPIETPDLTYVSALTMSLDGGASATLNGSYNGNGNNNMLLTSPVAILPPGGRITIKLKTLVNNVGIHLNQATGTGTGIPAGGVKTDTYDNTLNNQTVNNQSGGSYTINCQPANNCLSQAGFHNQANTDDPTGISLLVPSSAPASIAGRTQYADGTAVGRVQILMTRVSDGTLWTALTNSFGYFTFEGIPTGQTYVLNISTKRHRFPIDSQTITLTDDVSGIVFIAEGGTEVLGGKSLLTQTQSGKSVLIKSNKK